MDIISGLNKVICVALNASDNGKLVTISNGSSSWTATVANQRAEFLIPALPVPARREYTLTFGEFSRKVEIGYGDMITITLADGYEPVSENDFNEFKDTTTQLIGGVVGLLKDPNTDTMFKFGVDENGRYGYIKAGADSVTPFRTGQETLCYYLGQGRSFDIKAACVDIKNNHGIDLDYTKLTNNNFIAQPANDVNATKQSGFSGGDSDFTHKTYGIYIKPSVLYNNVTGKLDISGSTCQGKYQRWSNGAESWNNTSVIESTIKAYLIISMN